MILPWGSRPVTRRDARDLRETSTLGPMRRRCNRTGCSQPSPGENHVLGNPASDTQDVTYLPDDKLASLQDWWAHFQTRNEFSRWWRGYQVATKCCSSKTVAYSDSHWPDDRYRCTTCAKPKKGNFRPCLRLRITINENNVEVDRVVLVMPKQDTENPQANIAMSAFGYWIDVDQVT